MLEDPEIVRGLILLIEILSIKNLGNIVFKKDEKEGVRIFNVVPEV